jgi:tRNA-modifying protein YgfZ
MTPASAPPATPAAESSSLRSDLELLEIAGPDAPRFLQGQCTADVEALAVGRWTWAGYCTPKGRLLATFRVGRSDGAYLLQLPAGSAAGLATRLRRFVMRSKVTLTPLDTLSVTVRATGADASHRLLGALQTAAMAPGDLRTTGHATVFGTSDGLVAHLGDATATAMATALPASADAPLLAELADIRAGIPWILPPTEDMFVPQMVGLDRIDGVSFTKGCYPGQEIVARTRYLGTVKRHLYHLVLAGHAPPGEPVLADGQQVGTVLRAVAMPGQAVEALAVIDGAAAESGNLSTAAGPAADLRRLHPEPVA